METMESNITDTPLNSHHVNANIKYNILPDKEMRDIGFTDHIKDKWYFYREVGDEISFNVTIPKNGGELNIQILDEDFLQHYDFQYILKHNPNLKFALNVKDNVYKFMQYLIDKGVLSNWKPGDYI